MNLTEEEAKQTAHSIACGHAYWEHATHIAESGVLLSESSFQSLILETLLNPSRYRDLRASRCAFWNEDEHFLVIVNPNDPDSGTAYWPVKGFYEFKKLN